MQNVSRTEEPAVLRNNSQRWRRELIEKLYELRSEGRKKDKDYKNKENKYKHKDLKEALTRMYQSLCCYCETKISFVSARHIEHRKPKSRFPNSTFLWSNLHLCCPDCNHAKGEKYNYEAPILDAATDEIGPDVFDYDHERAGVWLVPKNARAETTENHANLNREDLRLKIRPEILFSALNLVREINRSGGSPEGNMVRKKLQTYCKEQHGSLFVYAIREFLREAQ